MKRKAENLDTKCNSGVNIDVTNNTVKETTDRKRKKVRFEKPLNNKPADKSTKKLPVIKKNPKNKDLKKGLKGGKHNATITQDKIEKTDWLKLKKEKKELKQKRKSMKVKNVEVYNVIIEAKRISERLRRSDCTPQNRATLTRTLHKSLETHYSRIVVMHDMSRIVQCMIKYCEADVRQAIFREIKPSIIEILQSKYAKNCVRAILKYGSQEIRSEVVSAFCGNIVKLLSHTVSAPLVELVYTSWCRDDDKIYFKQEFYGDMYKQAKDKAVKTLTDVFETAEGMKSATLFAVKANLLRILKKNLINSTLVHAVLYEFFCVCSAEDKSELIVALRSSVVMLSQTKMGTRVVAHCIWHGTNKDRKVIMKSLKENVKMVSTSEHGYMTLLALFDSIDDTIMLKKIILIELQKNLVDIALSEYGKHVILYLVARRDSHYFPPSVVEYLRQGDGNLISKKPADIRAKELLEAIGDSLLEAVTADPITWLSNSAIAMVTLAILKVGSGEKLNSAFQSIAKFISNVDSKIKQDDIECNVVEHSGLHMMLKKLIQNDKELQQRGESTFGEVLMPQLTAETVKKWTKFNRGCFLLVLLMENETKAVVSALFSRLKPLVKELKSKKSPGASILLKKIKEQ